MLDSTTELPSITRDCIDPWIYIEVRTNGDIAPCCARPPMSFAGEASLDEVRNGTAVRDLRQNLLEGTLDLVCAGCLLRPLTTPGDLLAKIRDVYSASRPAKHATANAEDKARQAEVARAEAEETDMPVREAILYAKRVLVETTTALDQERQRCTTLEHRLAEREQHNKELQARSKQIHGHISELLIAVRRSEAAFTEKTEITRGHKGL